MSLKENLNVLEKEEKYKNFLVPVKKEITKFDKGGNECVKTTFYEIKFIDGARFLARSLSNLIDNITERIHKFKREDCDYFLEYESVKDNLIKQKCLSCNKGYSNKLDKELKNKFKNTFKFSNNNINKYPYEYMDDWEKFNETTLPEKENFYSNLNMQEITVSDYMHRKSVCRDFEIKNLGEYHGL